MKPTAQAIDRTPRATLWLGLVLLSMILAGGLPGLPGLPSAVSPHGSPTHFVGTVPASPHHSSASRAAMAVHSQATPVCQDPNIGVDLYSNIVGVNGLDFWPLFPIGGGYPCPLTSQDPNAPTPFNDEQHATFSSSVLGSGDRFTVPIRLPGNSTTSEASYLHDFYVGMVVRGNASSVDGQSYLQVVFTPTVATNGGNDYSVTVSVWGLFDSGTCKTGNRPMGLNLTWNNLNACETDLIGNGIGYALNGPIPGGSYLHVTLNGAGSGGVAVFVNDTAQPKYSSSFTLSPSVATNQTTFTPYYNASCADLCYLNWSMPFGNGFGVDLGAGSFDTTEQSTTDPVWIGSPEYFNASGYAGDFSTLSLESASGGCAGATGTIPCPAIGSNWGYPYFQFNGTQLLFGSSFNYNWTTRDFGGVLGEFSTQGQPTDFDPLSMDEPRNSSQVGYIPSGSALTVSVRVQDLGSVGPVNLSYALPDGTLGLASMARVSGNRSIGVYNATIPTNGGDGTIVYSIKARSLAGTTERLPANNRISFTVVRGPIPSFTITFATVPSSCGSIEFNGLHYATFQSVTLPANVYSVLPFPCYPYVFSFWSASGIPIGPLLRSAASISVNLTANATLTAHWRYIRPFDTIGLAIDTNRCGSISLNRTVYSSNTTIRILDGLTYPLSYSQCPLNVFSGWVPSDPINLTILGGSPNSFFTPHGNGTIELTYLPTASNPVPVVFETKPAKCGGILFRGAGYVNGTSLSIASGVQYPVVADPCAGWGLDHWNATAGLTLSGGFLSALAPGILTATYYEETIVTIETYPPGCGYITINDVPYYNGSQIIVSNGSTFIIHAFPCAGYYFSGWYSTGGVFVSGDSMTIYGSGIIEAVFQHGAQTDFVAFITNPAGCGKISFNGVPYQGSQYIQVPPKTVATLVGQPCVGYGFVSWLVGGPGISISGNVATVNGSGSITANFHPLSDLTVYTNPSTCGAVTISGTPYLSGSIVALPAPDVFAVSAQPCAHYQLAYWTSTSGAAVSQPNGTLTLSSTAIVTAVFLPAVYDLLIGVTPPSCGGVLVTSGPAHNTYTNNTTVATPFGSYSITAKPCTGFHLLRWMVTGGVSVVSNSSNSTVLSIGASGNLTAIYEPVPPVVRLAVPTPIAVGSTVTLTADIVLPVPPYTYTYDWTFGDGSNATTHDGFVTHEYARPGTYLVHVSVLDPYHRTADANSTIAVQSAGSTTFSTIGVSGYVAIAAAVIAVVGAIALGRRRPGPPAGSEGGTPAPKPSSPPSDTPPP